MVILIQGKLVMNCSNACIDVRIKLEVIMTL